MTRKKVSTPKARAKGGERSLIMYRSRILSIPSIVRWRHARPGLHRTGRGPRRCRYRMGRGPPGAGLERVGELAAAGLSVVEDTGGALDPATQVELDALLDGEVLDSLRVGGPFASIGFIRERLDAFGEGWGGGALRVQPLARGG